MTIAWRTLPATTRRRFGKGVPVRMATRELLAPGQDPARGRLRSGQEALIGQRILVRGRKKGFAQRTAA